MTSVLTVPVAALAAIRQNAGRTPKGVDLGDPTVEQAGVAGRRIAFAYEFDAAEIAWLTSKLPLVPGAALTTGLPADWRWPTYAP